MRFPATLMQSFRWAFNCTNWQPCASDWVLAARCLQSEEKDRIGKFVFKRDAKSSMIGRLMLRKIIHQVTKIPYSEVCLGRTEKGKPYLIDELPVEYKGFSFNVSHHGDYVVLAAETHAEVGIDVMKLETPSGAKTVTEFFHIMRRQFTDEEMKCIQSGLTEREQLSTFYRLWCLKESYVKALGIGIGFEVKRLHFSLMDSLQTDGKVVTSTKLDIDGQSAEDWTFEEILIDNHCIAVAVNIVSQNCGNGNKGSASFEILTVEELLKDSTPLTDADVEYGQEYIKKDESPVMRKSKS